GGKIIGHTRSGKPIYESYDHPSHKNFTKLDHLDAGGKHYALKKTNKNEAAYGSPDYKREKTKQHHHDQYQLHDKHYAALTKEEENSKPKDKSKGNSLSAAKHRAMQKIDPADHKLFDKFHKETKKTTFLGKD